MIKNYITTALRSFRKHRGFTFINITGLAIGMACCILILLYVQDELSYDKYHDKAEQIYRAGINGKMGNREFMTYTSTPPLARTMIDEFPEVINATRFYEKGNTMVTYGDKKFIENKIFYVDSTVFDIFSWKLMKGNPKTALANPFTIVFTESMAKKYFGDEDPINKSVTFDNDTELKITGIMEDVPHNSHFHFDFLVSMNTTGWSERPIWLSDMFATYFLLEEGKTDKDVEAKLPELIRTHLGPQIQENLGVSMEEWLSSGNRYGYFLEPLTGIYLDSEANMQLEPVGDKRYVILFSIVALFILIIACVNFMNLTTAKASNRAKEVGVRKVTGAQRKQLITQFLSESVIISIFAMIVALILVYLLLPYFNQITQKELTLEYFSNIWYVPGLFLMAIFTGILAGSYSSFSLSSFGIITVLKGKIQSGTKSSWFRSGLVVFQYAISISIIIATFVVYQQLGYMQNKKLGFDKENVVVVKRPYALGEQLNTFKEELLKNPEIIEAGATTRVPGTGFNGSVYQREGAKAEEMIHFRRLTSDYEFPGAMGMKIKEGRYFSKEFPGDTNSVVINEMAVKALGYEDPVGKNLVSYGEKNTRHYYKIIGVMEDFHTESMRELIPNVVMFYPGQYRPSYLAVKVNGKDVQHALQTIQTTWQKFLPQEPFDYFFMDSHFAELHKDESRTGKLLGGFSILAIFIASLGLFGLSSFITEQRTKEIGIRKAMGSNIRSIMLLLNKQFSKWILLANLIAWPVAYYFMNNWLENFAYRIELKPWIFLVAGLVSILLAIITVSYQTVKAASANPVKSLRYE